MSRLTKVSYIRRSELPQDFAKFMGIDLRDAELFAIEIYDNGCYVKFVPIAKGLVDYIQRLDDKQEKEPKGRHVISAKIVTSHEYLKDCLFEEKPNNLSDKRILLLRCPCGFIAFDIVKHNNCNKHNEPIKWQQIIFNKEEDIKEHLKNYLVPHKDNDVLNAIQQTDVGLPTEDIIKSTFTYNELKTIIMSLDNEDKKKAQKEFGKRLILEVDKIA